MIGSMFVGFIVGLIAAAITNRGESMGCLGKILLGWFGSLIGQFLFGHWGPMLAVRLLFHQSWGGYSLGYFLETG
ncbi:transglycosylase associated protein [Streptococcus intermedius SK54 = ATCC 27335]|nr:transglycosylase associated protein [Streptococcus intermedius SK54 = ATCC 27335]EPH03636.1 hypothetical protein HMPREF1654_01496 [Streptococcus intermedius SK54 = ATCC 27335]SQH52530.1 integral membrane protein [Streptococcus intermedius]